MKGDLESKMVFHQKTYLHFVTAITIPNFIITIMSLWQMTACSLISLVVLLTDFWMLLPSGIKNVSVLTLTAQCDTCWLMLYLCKVLTHLKNNGMYLTLDIKMALFFYSSFVWVSMIMVKFYSVQCGPNIGLGRWNWAAWILSVWPVMWKNIWPGTWTYLWVSTKYRGWHHLMSNDSWTLLLTFATCVVMVMMTVMVIIMFDGTFSPVDYCSLN